MNAEPAPRVLGGLPTGAWVTVVASPNGYRLYLGRAAARDSRLLLLASAVAYFEESLTEPPTGLEASLADIAGVVAWLRGTAASPLEARLLREAAESVDDGLPGEQVARNLRAALRQLIPNEQADPVDLLVQATRS